jgi:REP element-mobilizing transposase RayT
MAKAVQLELKVPTHGGRREGAGRLRRVGGVAHRVRSVPATVPMHVTLRLVAGVSIRKEWLIPIIRTAIADSQKDGFRIVEFNVLVNHLHLLTEADGRALHASGMNGLKVRLARRLNRKLRRTGPLFAERYHARALHTPTEVRNALRYVLNNARHHAAEQGTRLDPDWIDTYSSGPWFDGWAQPTARAPLLRSVAKPTASAHSWLLRSGWRRYGLLHIDDVPGLPSPRRNTPPPQQLAPLRRARSPSATPQLSFL